MVLTETGNDRDSENNAMSSHLHYDITSYSVNDVMMSHGGKCLQTALFRENRSIYIVVRWMFSPCDPLGMFPQKDSKWLLFFIRFTG